MSIDGDSWVLEASRLPKVIGHQEDAWLSLAGMVVVHKANGVGVIHSIIKREKQEVFDLFMTFGEGSPKPYAIGHKHFEWIVFPEPNSIHPLLQPVVRTINQKEAARTALEQQKQQQQALQEEQKLLAQQEAAAEMLRLQEEERLRVQQQAAEASARIEFARLRDHFFGRSIHDERPSNPLFMILKKLDLGEELSGSEIEFLKKDCQYGPLAVHFENRFMFGNDPWDAIRGCSAWRKANPPQSQLGLDLVNRMLTSSEVKIAAAWTTRGGALKDLQNLTEAEQCGLRAIELEESYHPHNLLGSVYMRKEDPEAAAKHFLRAVALGVPDRKFLDEVQSEMNRADPITSQRAARYFLSIDPQRYAWAAKYL